MRTELTQKGLVTSVCLSVHVIQLESRQTDLYETWYGLYAIRD
jgi:hypothetical protein